MLIVLFKQFNWQGFFLSYVYTSIYAIQNDFQAIISMLTQWIYVWFQVLEVFDWVSFLFLIYINDIVNDIHANIRLFADDTSLYIIVDEPIQASTVLNTDLTKIITWSKTWFV